MYYVNGRYVKKEDALISVLDLSVLRGFGVFDYLRTYQGRPFHLEEHLMRLRYSVEQLGMELPLSFAEIETIVLRLKELNSLYEASIKIIVTGGISDDQFIPHQKPTLIILVSPLKAYAQECFTQGIDVITTQLSRSLPMSKTIQYTPAIVALQKSRAKEALYLNTQGEILEATTSNFFAFKQKTLYTCNSEEILMGITREVVLQLATPLFPLELRSIRYEELPEIDEAFITASNKEVMPVISIDGIPIGNGQVGPLTEQLMCLFHSYTKQESWPFLNISRYALNP